MTNQTRNALEAQIASFLSQGGQIQQVPTGASGAREKKGWTGGEKTAPSLPKSNPEPAA